MSLTTPLRAARAQRAALVAGIALSLTLTGCAAGQRAQTSNEFSVVDGVSADIGTIGMRNAGVTRPPTTVGYAAKGTATLTMAIVNNGPAADQLTAVSTPAATSVTLTPAVSGSTTAGSAPAVSPSPASASPTTAASASKAITLPPRGLVQVGPAPQNARITLHGLTGSLVSGQTIAVTFTFRDAGTTTVKMAVKLVPNSSGGETIDIAPTDA